MTFELRRLSEIAQGDIIALMTNPSVRAHMPLARGVFDEDACRSFVEGKEQQWTDNGYGPWAFVIDGQFAGWGGFQKEEADVDLAIVLGPRWWGHGPSICRKLLARGFAPQAEGGFGFSAVTIMLPPSRRHFKALKRLGFQEEGPVDYLGERFVKLRISADSAKIARMPSDFA
jgi:ribosomal-protein-alanine N-acetyltransferase